MRGIVVRGELLRAARLEQGHTQAALARLAGLDAKTIRKAEQGKRIDLVPLSRLANALNTDVNLLIATDGDAAGLKVRQWAVLMKWLEAFDACDGVAVGQLFSDVAEMRIGGAPNIPFGGIACGRGEIQKAHEQSWVNRHEPTPLDEMTIHVGDSVITVIGERAVYLPSGELHKFPTTMIFAFDGDLICQLEVQFDTLEFARRMNLIS